MTEAVLYDVTESGVAVLTLNRPERLNSWGADISAGSTRVSIAPRLIPRFGSSC